MLTCHGSKVVRGGSRVDSVRHVGHVDEEDEDHGPSGDQISPFPAHAPRLDLDQLSGLSSHV